MAAIGSRLLVITLLLAGCGGEATSPSGAVDAATDDVAIDDASTDAPRDTASASDATRDSATDAACECGPKPTPTLCTDGTAPPMECVRASSGACVWQESACPGAMPCNLPSHCPPGNYCKLPIGSCGGKLGSCAPIPMGCAPDVVCGCDRVEYASECEAASKYKSIDYKGPCMNLGVACAGDADCKGGAQCFFPPGVCPGTTGAKGTCQKPIVSCTTESDPVCGCDGTTYTNPCLARKAGVAVLRYGRCEDAPRACGMTSCSFREYCDLPFDSCGTQTGTCKPRPEGCSADGTMKVCGCTGTTYLSLCHARMAGAMVKSAGACM